MIIDINFGMVCIVKELSTLYMIALVDMAMVNFLTALADI